MYIFLSSPQIPALYVKYCFLQVPKIRHEIPWIACLSHVSQMRYNLSIERRVVFTIQRKPWEDFTEKAERTNGLKIKIINTRI